VIDLGDRGAQRRQPRALPERLAYRLLQHRQLALGDADLVLPAACRDHPRGILRVLAKIHHVRGDPPHRPYQQPLQAEIDERRGDQ
jgi:hypothetical protein